MVVDLDKSIAVFVAIFVNIYIFLQAFHHLEVHQQGCSRDDNAQNQFRKH